jgi:hypothetical protein
MFRKLSILLLLSIALYSCKDENKPALNYEEIKHEVMHDSLTTVDLSDTTDLFDSDKFDPEKDSVAVLLDSLEHIYEKDSAVIKEKGINDTISLDQFVFMDTTISNPRDSFTNDIRKITTDEIKALRYNLKQLHDKDSILAITHEKKTGQIESRVWARVSKSDQRLYLYIDGEIADTFKVSTGSTRHETPAFDMQPSGPIFQKYTSKKYPGGNYNGLGNMPYAIFIKGGYALHGTTRGNIPRLGNKASHGCVRLHPDNAKILNELVRKAGIENFWVTIEEG